MHTMIKGMVVFVFIAIVLAGAVSAQNTLVLGTVYKEIGNNLMAAVKGANVSVSCGDVTKEVISNSKGNFGTKFSDLDCVLNDIVTVNAQYGDLTGTGEGNVAKCDGEIGCSDINATFIAIANPIMSNQQLINGECGVKVNECSAGNFLDLSDTSLKYYWACTGIDGGKDVDCSRAKFSSSGSSGSSSSTTVKKAANVTKLSTKNVTSSERVLEEATNDSANNPLAIEDTNSTQDSVGGNGGLSGITGSFLAGGSGSWIAVLVVLIAIIIAFLILGKPVKEKEKGKKKSADQ